MNTQDFKWEVPTSTGGADRLEVDMLPVGEHLVTLYAVVDLGTQETNFGEKHQIQLTFEVPLEKRVFWKDQEPRPKALFVKETFNLGERANLRKKYIEPMLGRPWTKQDEQFPIPTLVGTNYVADIVHNGNFENIRSIKPLTSKNMIMFGLQQPTYPMVNEPMIFHLAMGFESEAFAKLPTKLRDLIIGSKEGREHAARGGRFAEQIKKDYGNGNASAPAPQAGGRKLVMNPTSQWSYEQLKASDWTDDQIVEAGHATWQAPVQPPQPVAAPSAPAPASPAPAAPQPQAPMTPPPAAAPVAPSEPKLVMKDPSQDIEQWRSTGWTDELLVQHGHAEWVK